MGSFLCNFLCAERALNRVLRRYPSFCRFRFIIIIVSNILKILFRANLSKGMIWICKVKMDDDFSEATFNVELLYASNNSLGYGDLRFA
jgi:hypothetical protein